MTRISLSERMRVIASMVLPGKPLADIGTDHGLIPADLLLKGTVPFAVLTDINAGPLKKCRANLESLGVDPKLYEIRQGDGLDPVSSGGFGTVIIAGMGGELIADICEYTGWSLTRPEGTPIAERNVFQPRTHEADLRSYLTQSEMRITDYKLARERGRICEVFAAEPCPAGSITPDSGLVSEFLLEKGDPLLAEYVDGKVSSAKNILESLKNSSTEEAQRQRDIYSAIYKTLTDIRKNL